MTAVRRFGAAVLAVFLLLGLVGCSGSNNNGASGLAGQQSPQGPQPLTKDEFANALATAQAKADTAHIEATIKATGQSGKISADVKGLGDLSNVAMDMAFDLAGTKLQVLVVDKLLYVKGAGFSTDPGKPWLKVDVSDPNNPMAQLFDSANPANYTAYLKGITDFEDKGLQTVDGVQTRHYAVTVDTAKMLAGNPAFHGQTVSSLGLPNALTSEVYVDSDNRPVKMSVDLGSVAAFEAHFSRYGDPVDISAPPADQVSEFSL